MTKPAYVMVKFARASVSKVRLYVRNYANKLMNVFFQYTNDDTPNISTGSFTDVAGLTSGDGGTELLEAGTISNGHDVANWNHDSVTGANWCSMTFTAVTCTAIRIGFSELNYTYNHWEIYEFEAYGV